MRYGGDTSCVEVRVGDTLFVFDAGTGIRRLGAYLMTDPDWNGVGHILLSHFHWDHIQGFPFFRPAFVPTNRFHIYGAFKADKRLEESMRGQMGSIYFPIEMSDMPSSFQFTELLEEEIEIEGCRLMTRQLHHPQGCFGYRLESPSGSIAYCTDTEPLPEGLDPKVVELAKGVDLFICDAQFTPEEYVDGKQGWGHSTWEDAARMAEMAQCKKLVLYHHDPYHTDEEVDAMLEAAREIFPETIAATRDLELFLGSKELDATAKSSASHGAASKKNEAPNRNVLPQVEAKGETVYFQTPKDLAVFNSDSFRKAVLETLTPDAKRVVFDLANLDFLDSSGIGSLAAIFHFAKGKGLTMGLCNPSEQILEVLKITRFHMLVGIFATREDAEAGTNPLV